MAVKNYVGKLALVLAIVLMAGSALYAKNSQTMTLAHSATLGSAKLEPGSYKLTWQPGAADAAVTVTRGKKVVATAQGKWVKREAQYNSNSVVYSENPDGSHSITEIRFANSDEVLVFGDDATAQGAGSGAATQTPAAQGEQLKFPGKARVSKAQPMPDPLLMMLWRPVTEPAAQAVAGKQPAVK